MNDNNEKLNIEDNNLDEVISLEKKKIIEKDNQIKINWDLFIRAKAEIENIKKQNLKDIENIKKYVLKDFAKELINVIDSLENAFEANKENYDEGFNLINKMLINILEKYSIKKIAIEENAIFDPVFHEVVNIDENSEKENNVILNVLQSGYTIHDQVLRYSKVSISKKK